MTKWQRVQGAISSAVPEFLPQGTMPFQTGSGVETWALAKEIKKVRLANANTARSKIINIFLFFIFFRKFNFFSNKKGQPSCSPIEDYP